ncbi:MAG: hypothetical protein Q4B85_12345, partial [Lachnospiraceae bacterium]|nr:hypothetical protein [Lachnospiraceae bacterium]
MGGKNKLAGVLTSRSQWLPGQRFPSFSMELLLRIPHNRFPGNDFLVFPWNCCSLPALSGFP